MTLKLLFKDYFHLFGFVACLLFQISPDVCAQKGTDTLPVELIYFKAIPVADSVLLQWGTATEVSNFGFAVQKTVAKIDWEDIGFVPGSGNSNSPKHYTFMDVSFVKNGKYYYRLKQYDTDGAFEYSDTIEVDFVSSIHDQINGKQYDFNLYQNYPNPFNGETTISFSLSSDNSRSQFKSTGIKLTIYDLLGQEVAAILNGYLPAGKYELKYNSDDLVSGIYFYKLQYGSFSQTKKFLLMK